MNIFKQFYKSIYSPKNIALFRFQGIGKTILYVFFLTLISLLPAIIYLSTTLSTGIDTARTVINNELPSFSIKNGQLSAATNVPIKINKDNFTIILDPTGAISESDVTDEGNAFALLKNKFVFATGGRTDTSPYSMMQGIDITKKSMLNFIETIDGVKGIIIPVISIFLYLFSSASNFIEISVLALIGLAIKNLAGRKLNYRQLWRMAVYSETLPTIFFTIMAAIKTTVPNSFLINWFVAIIVLYLAINEIPKPKKSS
ncbi:MAG TPA: DUF1189 domain-containing protein [Neobacillus sp.]|jgi:hypothetical protein